MKDNQMIMEQAKEACLIKDVCLTQKREQVLQCLIEAKQALSAYEIIDVFGKKYQKDIKPMSLYRILDFLIEVGLIHKLAMMSKYVACIHITCSHYHSLSLFLICHQCGKVKETTADKILMQQLEIVIEEADYCFLSPHIELSCLCTKCQMTL